MRYSDFKKLAAATKTPSATPTNSIPKSTVGAVNMPKQTTLSNTPMVGAAQAKTPTANPAPTTNALPNTNTATAVQDRVKSWVNGPNQQNSMFTKPNYWSKENIAKATQQPQQPQQTRERLRLRQESVPLCEKWLRQKIVSLSASPFSMNCSRKVLSQPRPR